MKIRRFHAEDVRATIRKVREALGPDAVILSNKRVNGGVEIVAAIDYDESLIGGMTMQSDIPAVASSEVNDNQSSSGKSVTGQNSSIQNRAAQGHSKRSPKYLRQQAADDVRYSRNIPNSKPITENEILADNKNSTANTMDNDSLTAQDLSVVQSEIKSLRGLLLNQLSGMAWESESKYHPTRTRLWQRLIALGLSPSLSKQLCADVDETKEFDAMWRHALGLLSHKLPVIDNDILKTGGVMALVGPTGVGKTTTIAKLAARCVLQHGKDSVGLITTDNFRVAAHEQLRSYARILGVPLRIAIDKDELNDALYDLRNKRLVLIDTAGVSLQDSQLRKQLDLLNNSNGDKTIHMFLALAANTQRSVLNNIVKTFKQSRLDGCILTKIDETTSLGGAISTAVEHDLAISYFCDGQKVPDDLHIARAHNLVGKSVAIMQSITMAAQKDLASSSQSTNSMALTVNGMIAHAHG